MIAAFVLFLVNVGREVETVVANEQAAPTLLPQFLVAATAMVDISLLVVAWAAIVALSRVMLGRHHVGDVVAGIIIGFAQFVLLQKVLWIPAHQATYMHTTAMGALDQWGLPYFSPIARG